MVSITSSYVGNANDNEDSEIPYTSGISYLYECMQPEKFRSRHPSLGNTDDSQEWIDRWNSVCFTHWRRQAFEHSGITKPVVNPWLNGFHSQEVVHTNKSNGVVLKDKKVHHDTQLNDNAVWLNQPWKPFTTLQDLRVESEKYFSCILYCRQKHEESKSNRGASLTLRESVGLKWGSVLPLDFVSRIHSSKFWVMEADNKADLLIICRWANPVQLDDVKCGICDRQWFKPVSVGCHTFCAGCVRDQFANGIKTCPTCKKSMKKKFSRNELAEILLRLYEEERHRRCATATGRKHQREDDEYFEPNKKLCITNDSDVTLNADHVMTLFKALYKAREDWYFIGGGIGCTTADLNEIQTKHSSDDRMCLHQVLQIRIQKGGLTRSMLCDSLREEFVGRDDVAQEIEALKL